MKRKSKRLLALLLASSMAFAMTACGDKPAGNVDESNEVAADYFNKEGYPICDEPITITLGGYSDTKDWDNTYAAQYWKENLGIITDSTPINSKETLKTQYALMIAENDLPDIMLGIDEDTAGKEQVNIDGEAGYWLDFTDYLEYMPNLVAFWEKYPHMKAYDCTEDGSCYSLNRVKPGIYNNIGGMIYYDKAAVEAVYPDPIKTIDDFYDALVAVQKAYPERKPFGMSYNHINSQRGDVIIQSAFGIESRDREYMIYEDDNGEVVLGDTTENYRAYLDFMNKLYEEKLLDNDCFIMSNDEFSASQKNGDYVFWGHQTLVGASGVGTKTSDYSFLACLTSEWNEEGTFILSNGIEPGARICVSADTKYPEAICRLIDFWLSEEGMALNRHGVEGVHYDYVVKNDFDIPTRDFEERYKQYMEAHPEVDYENSSVWQQQHIYIFMNYLAVEPSFADEADIALLEEIVEASNTGAKSVSGIITPAKTVLSVKQAKNVISAPIAQRYTSDETKEIATLQADIKNYISTFKADAIRGVKDPLNDDDWKEYISTLERMGLKRLMEIETAAFRRAGN